MTEPTHHLTIHDDWVSVEEIATGELVIIPKNTIGSVTIGQGGDVVISKNGNIGVNRFLTIPEQQAQELRSVYGGQDRRSR